MAQTLNFLNKANQNYVLSVANRIFVEKGYHLLPKFEDIIKNFYKMNVERLNFELPSEAEKRINDWVSDETRKQITSIIPPGVVDPMTRMVLTNGIYFKGDWQTMFDETSTVVLPFHVSKERQVRVPFMFVESSFPYYNFERLGFEMLELPYTGGDVSMFIVLPYPTNSLLTVARRLKSRPFLLNHLKRLNSKSNVSVVLPKFKFTHSLDLKSALKALGVNNIFEQGKADLSKIAGNDELHVSDAFHKAAVEVSERGTTASAASAMVIRGRSMSSDPLVRADRPFIFFIRHNPSSSILFMGAINDFPDDNTT